MDTKKIAHYAVICRYSGIVTKVIEQSEIIVVYIQHIGKEPTATLSLTAIPHLSSDMLDVALETQKVPASSPLAIAEQPGDGGHYLAALDAKVSLRRSQKLPERGLAE